MDDMQKDATMEATNPKAARARKPRTVTPVPYTVTTIVTVRKAFSVVVMATNQAEAIIMAGGGPIAASDLTTISELSEQAAHAVQDRRNRMPR